MSAEFHIFTSEESALFELEAPGEDCRIEFASIIEAARHAQAHPDGKGATMVVHECGSSAVNRIPL